MPSGGPLYTTLIITPVALALEAFSGPLVRLVCGGAYKLAPEYLELPVLQWFLTPLGSHVVGAYFNTIGATTVTMMLQFVGTGLNAALATALIPRYGVLGLIASGLAAGLASQLLSPYTSPIQGMA